MKSVFDDIWNRVQTTGRFDNKKMEDEIMLEFIQKEVWVAEKGEINRSQLFSFFLPDNTDALIIPESVKLAVNYFLYPL